MPLQWHEVASIHQYCDTVTDVIVHQVSAIMAHFSPQSDQACVEARITYNKAPPAGEEAFKYLYQVPEGQRSTNHGAEQFAMPVTDLRHGHVKPFTLTRNGFQLERLRHPAPVQWDNAEEVRCSLEDGSCH